MDKKTNLIEQINKSANEAAEYVNNLTNNFKPRIGILFGTGLSDATLQNSEIIYKIPYRKIPNFKSTKIKSHKGEMVFTKMADKDTVLLLGRYHLYEGYNMQDVVFPIHVLNKLGVEYMIITNAVGGINFKPGDLVMLKDHINFLHESPLTGYTGDDIFLNCLNMYDNELSHLALQVTKENGIELKKGIQGLFRGPQFQTRAEIRYLKMHGCDTVGWSNIPESILAHYLGMKILSINCVSDDSDPETVKEVDLDEIIDVAKRASGDLYKLIFNLAKKI